MSDFGLLAGAVWLGMSLGLGRPYVPTRPDVSVLLLSAPAIGVGTFAWFGLYRVVTRFFGPSGTGLIAACIGLSVLIWALLVQLSGLPGVPRTAIAIFAIAGFALTYGSRQMAAWLLRGAGIEIARPWREQRCVVIYGAGQGGAELVAALRRSGEGRAVGFIDESATLWGQYVHGLKVYRPEKLEKFVTQDGVRDVFLAIPDDRRHERRAALKRLERFPVRVKLLPAIADIAAGRVTVADFRPVEIEDLLGRDTVPADYDLLARSIAGKSVMVTGAGGSIGTELIRQILRQRPSRMVLFELSETALYEIEMEAAEIAARMADGGLKPAIIGVLGSVLDAAIVREAIERHGVEAIYHAAAYKHVPIVERNIIAGLSNNAFGTAVVAAAARTHHVERFVLVSTDKAVRPTNIMGASKRLAELIVQAHAKEAAGETIFTIVRFGNVLDSSGSVFRLFRKQIQSGGPVTVTHPDVTRYFMSIPEAADLVLHAGAMAGGEEVFVLDMGEPVKINDLARSMIRLMGLEVKSPQTPDGEIAIEYVGLRSGEKLHEELSIGEHTSGTAHPRILRNAEPSLTTPELTRELDVLRLAIADANLEAIQAVLMRIVDGYRPLAPTGADQSWVSASRTLH